MVRLQDFDKITYKKPRFFPAKPLSKIIGFDSEAYRDGTTFMFCTSDGDVILPSVLIDTLFTTQYESTNFVTWNLKYESGAILKLFPRPVIKALQVTHKTRCVYHGMKLEIQYIPHKCLKIKQIKFAGHAVRFWDISPFYGRCKLDTAASTYLHESKDDMDPKLFTTEYVSENFERIASYCIKDSVLTKKLADMWIDKFSATGVPVTSLYSEASISFAYFSQHTDIITPFEFWDYNRRLLRYAFESYEGGKFEITHRGKFTGYEYDISSAYPFEIANLLDIRNAEISYSSYYNHNAAYGFLRVSIRFTDKDTYLPCGLFRKLRIYPTGFYFLTITKQEYDYIKELPYVKIDIIQAAWITVYKRSYPYRDIVNELYELKSRYKKSDPLRSRNYKIIMNGFYGKLAQCLPANNDTYNAGAGWNPVYASVITANTRIAVTRLQNLLKDDCYAVHTDSVITRKPLPDSFIGKGLGKFELVEQGDGVLVGCGIYEINGQCALKGFRKNSIVKILKENPGKSKIKLSLVHVESWIQAMAQNHEVGSINLFSDILKILTLNCDTKRLWPEPMCSDDFLNKLQKSHPLVVKQTERPSYWKD